MSVSLCYRNTIWWKALASRFYSTGNLFPVIPPSSLDRTVAPSYRDQHLAVYADLVKRREEIYAHARSKEGGVRKTARERLSCLADKSTEMLEIGLLAGLGLPYGDVPSAGYVVCITQVSGETCVVSANDWTIKGGASYPITVKKQLRAQEIALQSRLPCIYLVDSAGGFLPLQSELYPDKEHGGRVFRNEAVLSSLAIPQIAVVTGSCTAGGAYVPTMCDEAVMVEGAGSLYLAGPPLVRTATGEVLTSEELGGAHVHCSISGCTDHFAKSEEEAFSLTRRIVSTLHLPYVDTSSRALASEAPLYSAEDEDFAAIIPARLEEDWPMLDIVARVVDGSKLHQFKERFGTHLIAGFARLSGRLIGLLANQGVLDAPSALKGAHFIRLCSMRGIPLVFLVNTPSDADFLSSNGTAGLVAKARAQMISCLATSTVTKLTVIVGGSYGASSIAMCGRSMEPHFTFCWPHGRMALASPAHLCKVLGQQMSSSTAAAIAEEELAREESIYPSSSLYHDGIILPSETRLVLSQCLAITSRYRVEHQKVNINNSLAVLRM